MTAMERVKAKLEARESGEHATAPSPEEVRALVEENERLRGVVRRILGVWRPGGSAECGNSLEDHATYPLYATGATIRKARRSLTDSEEASRE